MLLNNTGIILKPKFYFITLKFVTRGVCGYLDGPCCLLTTTGAAQRNAQSTVQPQHPSPQNPKNFKVDFRKKYGSYGALDRPKFLRKLCSFVRSYLRPWGPKTLGSGKSLNPPYPNAPPCAAKAKSRDNTFTAAAPLISPKLWGPPTGLPMGVVTWPGSQSSGLVLILCGWRISWLLLRELMIQREQAWSRTGP